MALIGVYLVILGFELDPELLDLEPLEPPPLASDSTTITRVMRRTRNTAVASRIFAKVNTVQCFSFVILPSLIDCI